MPNPTSAVRPLLAVLAILAVAGTADAQLGGPKLKIADVRIGFPPGRFVTEREDNERASNVFKRNTWAPLYLTLEVAKEVSGNAWVVIEAPDADDLRTTISFPLGNLSDQQPGAVLRPIDFPFIPYVRPAERGADVTVSVCADPDGRKPLADPRRVSLFQNRDTGTYVVLSLGTKLPGFDLPGEETKRAEALPGMNKGALRGGRVETAALTNVREMPDQWFGYAGADLVVLATGSAPNDFLQELFDPQKSAPFAARREALLEWVRRGGRLVVSVGSNAGMLSGSDAFKAILPARLADGEPSRGVTELPLSWEVFGRQENKTLRPKADTFPVARLVADPDRPPRVLIPKPEDAGQRTRGSADLPVVVQAPFGLGRVTVVAFDLDRSPFVDFADRPAFWDWLLKTAGSERAPMGQLSGEAGAWGGYSDAEDTFAGRLRDHVDNFEGVPVISFGWVALFIVLYTLLIGPVEYVFLKKVVGRLELTWVTFPLIVLSVSAAAYFTAYAIKGNDLKVNKVDVVDVDPASGRVYGRSWFTIFSPRIDSYTIGIEPRDGWAVTRPNDPNPPRTLVDWMAGGRSGGGNLVSRGYTYHTDEAGREVADGLLGVPIQVWSTKAFTANWSGYLDPGSPAVESLLYHPPGDPKALAGSFVNRLPVGELKDVLLIYGGMAYEVEKGVLTPGEYRPVLDRTTERPKWLADAAQINRVSEGGMTFDPRTGRSEQVTVASLPMWGALFHERVLPRDQGLMNASLRDLDQSWRVSDRSESVYLDQAILLANVEASGLAEPLMSAADGPSPTRLWYKALPGPGATRDAIPGTLRQETYVRVYLPVSPRPR